MYNIMDNYKEHLEDVDDEEQDEVIEVKPKKVVEKPKRTRKMTEETLEKLKVARERAKEAQAKNKVIKDMEKEIIKKEKEDKVNKIKQKHKELLEPKPLPKEEEKNDVPLEEPKPLPKKEKKKKSKKPIVIVQEDDDTSSSSSSDEDQQVVYIKRRSKKKKEKTAPIPIPEPKVEETQHYQKPPPIVRQPVNPFFGINYKKY